MEIKKILAIFFIILIISTIIPNKAKAVVGVEDVVTDPVEEISTISGWAERAVEWVKTNYYHFLRDIVAKRIIDTIVDQTVKWVQGGGEPKFVTDWDGFMKDAGDIAFDSVIKSIGAAGLCSPFGLQVKLALLPVKKFSQQISCTLDKVVGNIKNFYVDFSVGGWDGYLVSLEPQNNFYGAMLLAEDEAIRKMAEAKLAAQNDATAGNGFLSVKKCKTSIKAGDNGWYQVDEKNYSEYDLSGLGYVKDGDGNFCKNSDLETQTPGNVVGQAVGSAITSDTQWAANIDSWVSAIANAVINKLVQEGLKSMSPSKPNAPPDYYPEEYASLRASAQGDEKQKMIDKIREMGSTTGQSGNVLTIKQQTADYASSTLAMLKEMKSLGCSVTDDEILAAENNLNNFTSDADNASSILSEQDQLISDIQNADPSNAYEWNQILERYNDYINGSITTMQNTPVQEGQVNPYSSDGQQQIAQDKLTAAIDQNNAVSAKLTLCKSPIVINNGDDTTANVDVTLKLNATSSLIGVTSTDQMMIANDSSFSAGIWETYSTVKSWTLSAGVGLKTVYVKFRDSITNTVSSVFSDDITLQ